MSYNIRYDNPNDGEDNWHKRKQELTAQIQKEKPDFLAAQEVLFGQLSYLTKNLTKYSYVGIGREDGKTKGEFAALFYQKQKWKCLKNKTIWLSETPDTISIGWDADLERICTYALFENKSNRKKIWVLNTHFDHVGLLTPFNSARLFLSTIKKLQKDNIPVILMGDFNSIPEGVPILLLSEKLDDAFAKQDKVQATFNDFNIKKEPKHKIDYIFSKGIQVEKTSTLIEKRANGRYISDHFPLILEFKIKSK